jgi:hypothetical protein
MEYVMKTVSLIMFAVFNLTALGSYAVEAQPITDSQTATPAPRRLVLPLDHGPRAQSTTWVNNQLRMRANRDQKLQQDSNRVPSNHSEAAPAKKVVPHESMGE